MDFVGELWRRGPDKHRVALAGTHRHVLSSLAFAIAHRAVAADPSAFAIILAQRSESPPLVVGEGSDHGDGAELDRIWFKYLDTAGDAAWFLNNVQRWSADTRHPRPTLLVLDGWLSSNLLVLLKLADDAARHLGADAVVTVPADDLRKVVARFFPTHVAVRSRAGDCCFVVDWPRPRRPPAPVTPSSTEKSDDDDDDAWEYTLRQCDDARLSFGRRRPPRISSA